MSDPVVLGIRPSPAYLRALRRRNRPVLAIIVTAGVARAAFFSVRITSAIVWNILFGILVIAIVGGAAAVALRIRNYRLLVGPADFGDTSLLGNARWHSRAELDRIVSVTVDNKGAALNSPQWLFLNRQGHRIMAMNPQIWDRADLVRLRAALAAPFEQLDERPLPIAEVAQRLPNAVPWWQTHMTQLIVFATLGLGTLICITILTIR